jgi:hypothetical protein
LENEGRKRELGLGLRTERSEAPVASSIRRARGGEREREMGRGVALRVPRGGGRKRERGRQRGIGSRVAGSEWL